MSKLCGYCRLPGHTMPKCELRNNQIGVLRRHVGRERLNLATMLRDSGFGNGALVQGYSYQYGENTTMIVTDFNESVPHYQNPMWDSRNMKYTKKVRMTLRTITGTLNEELPDDITRVFPEGFYVVARPLDNVNDTYSCYFRICDLSTSKRTDKPHYYSWNRHSLMIAPSTDGDVDMDMVMTPFKLPDRLGGQYVAPILP